MYEFIKTTEAENIGIITLYRLETLNAWHKPMRDELIDALKNYENNQNIRATILTGAGDRGFCAGQDLEEAETFDPDGAEAWMEEWHILYDLIRRLTKPLVAALNGLAAGSGFQVALLADVRIAHPGVTMGQPEINSGIASVTGPWIMKEMLGLSRTIELTLTGRMMDAQECYQIGLVHKIVPREELMNQALQMAKFLAAKPPIAMRLTKQRFREATEQGFQEMLAAGIRIQRDSFATSEPRSMMQEFLGKRTTKREE